MKEKFDVIVVGAGVMGSSTAYHLARGNKRVLLLERFSLGHHRGQSYGESRAFSLAYDTEERVKLALQSRALWQDLEHEVEEKLLFRTGGLDIVEDETDLPSIRNSSGAMRAWGVPFEEWGYEELKKKCPAWHLSENVSALYSPDDGILQPTRTTAVLVRQAARFGAMVRDEEPVEKILSGGSALEVKTPRSRYTAGILIICCGAWTNSILSHLNFSLPIKTSQEQTVYFKPRDGFAAFTAGIFPTWFHYKKPLVYGFPVFDLPGIKVGFHYDGFDVDTSDYNGLPRDCVTNRLRSYLEKYLPDAAGESFGAVTCLYDNSPDKDFIVDRIPGMPNVLVGAGFSGHGFNSAISIGKALADLALYGETDICIGKFGIRRFQDGLT